MSVIEYQFLDPSADQARWSGSLNPSPLTLLGPFAFSFATAGLTAGVPLCTLPVGAVIYDIGVEIATAFNGTTPMADVGTFSSTAGLFDELAGAPVDLTAADAAVTDNTGLANPTAKSWLAAAIGSVGALGGAAYLPGVLYVTAISTLELVVSQTGAKGGSATAATAGAGAVYVLAATPFTS